jgi:hypothetical protein
MGEPAGKRSAGWSVYHARSTDGGHTFRVQRRLTSLVHRGAVCTDGEVCPGDGSRDLFDDFGIAISPTTGATAIVYTSDQPQGDLKHDFVGFVTVAPLTRRALGGETKRLRAR